MKWGHDIITNIILKRFLKINKDWMIFLYYQILNNNVENILHLNLIDE